MRAMMKPLVCVVYKDNIRLKNICNEPYIQPLLKYKPNKVMAIVLLLKPLLPLPLLLSPCL